MFRCISRRNFLIFRLFSFKHVWKIWLGLWKHIGSGAGNRHQCFRFDRERVLLGKAEVLVLWPCQWLQPAKAFGQNLISHARDALLGEAPDNLAVVKLWLTQHLDPLGGLVLLGLSGYLPDGIRCVAVTPFRAQMAPMGSYFGVENGFGTSQPGHFGTQSTQG